MKKMLYILNVAKGINSFSYASICAAKAMGIEFHIAGNWGYASEEERQKDEEKYGIHIHQIDFIRAPYDFRNRKAMRQLREAIDREKFDVIHCNTPVGGLLGRLAGKKCGVKKVIYQVHGFHFYKGAPFLNWLIYYPIERFLARYTDTLITINREDYNFAQRLKLRNRGKVYYVPGVGIDTEEFQYDSVVHESKRKELGLSNDEIMLISAGELNENKNNRVIISALSVAKDPKIKYFLCGVGEQKETLREQTERVGLGQQVHFLGYRQDMKELLQAADVFVMPSFREGLSRSIMEAMSCGLPCVVSKIRGNEDLVEEGLGGFLRAPEDVSGFAKAIKQISENAQLRQKMREYNLEQIKKFDVSVVEKELCGIYTEMLQEH